MTALEKLKLATSFCGEFPELKLVAVIGIKKSTGNGTAFLLADNEPITEWEISKEEIEEVQATAHCQEIPNPNNRNFSNN
jgi:hypothetical protein